MILSCGWLEFYALIYQVNVRTYSAKYIIFMVCFLSTDFSYNWSRLWLLFQEPWRSLKKLEEALSNFKTLAATDYSCSSWFEPCNLSTTSRILTPMTSDICNTLLKFISPLQVILLININNYGIIMIHKELAGLRSGFSNFC